MTRIDKEWDKFLNISKLEKYQWFTNIFLFIDKIYKESKHKVCPDKHNIFKMFKMMKPDEIKVFMCFQDPYVQLRKNECVADGIGLAASYLTPSLKHFYKAIDENYEEKAMDITMMSLVLQGVFSINKYLTVSKIPLSHSKYNAVINNRPVRYDLLIKYVIRRLNKEFKNIVYIFFGKEAAELSSEVNQDDNLAIITSHPSPRGYKYGLMESNFAEKTNNYLKQHNKSIILW